MKKVIHRNFSFYFVITLLLAGCSLPQTQSMRSIESTPLISEDNVSVGDGTKLPLRQWQPQQTPQAVILALHGFNDYSNAFEIPAAYLAEKGVLTYAYDQRGFGKTERRGIWAAQDNIERDLIQVIKAVSARHPQLPLYILGESMGGAVIAASMVNPDFPHHAVEGVILSAPALWGENTLNPIHRLVLWVMAHQFPSMQMTGKGLKILASDNIEMLNALGKDPLIIKETRIDAIYGLLQLMDKAHANITKINKPTLILYGQNDQVIPPITMGSVMYQLQQTPASPLRKNLKLAYYTTGWHMLLRDMKRQKVLDDIIAWIKNHESALPSSEEATPENFWQKMREYREHLQAAKTMAKPSPL